MKNVVLAVETILLVFVAANHLRLRRKRQRELRREAAEERALWEEAADWRPATPKEAEWSEAGHAARDAEDKLRRAVEGEREQAASDWQDAQLRLDQAKATLRRGEDEREEEGMLQGVLKAYMRKERLEAFAYAAPRVALLVGGVAAIVGAVIAVVALVND